MQDQSPNDGASTDARAATIKLVFKKAMLSKLGQSVSSAADHLKEGSSAIVAPDTPKTAEKKTEKDGASGKKKPQQTNAAASKATPSKSLPVKASPSKAAASKGAAKRAAPQKQKRAEQSIDAASLHSDMGRAVMSSTAGLDLADAGGDAIPMNRVRRMMKELLGDLKLSNESVAAVVCSCQGFINYMTTQVC